MLRNAVQSAIRPFALRTSTNTQDSACGLHSRRRVILIAFSTVFPLNHDATADKFSELAKTWLEGSPHSSLAGLLPSSDSGIDDWEVSDTDEHVEAHKIVDGDTTLFGLRYTRDEASGMRWITEVHYAGTPDGNSAAVNLYVDSDSTALWLPKARKPYIVKQLVSHFGEGEDGDFLVTDRPYYLNPNQIEFAASIVEGNCRNTLPIVYVSAFGDEKRSVDPRRLAQWLSGIAHVVVEPDRHFSFRLAVEVDHRNTYGGAVGIYWPDRDVRSLVLPREFEFDPKAIANKISKVIRDRAVRLRIPRILTWANLKESRARIQLDKLRQSGSQDLNEYIESFDQELEAKEQSLAEAENEVRRLEAEVRSLRARTKPLEGQPLLVRGIESDLYEDECLCLAVDALKQAIGSSAEGSRRYHVLSSLISANPVEDHTTEYADTIKRLLSTYQSMEPATAHDLEELGFEISSDGKHHKLIFRGDSRYQVSMSKTSSDHRAGKNLVSEINRLLF